MNETARLEQLLSTGTDVRLAKSDAYEVLQKLRARGGRTEATERLEAQLAGDDEVVLERGEAKQLLEELKASGRRWISGTDAPREQPVPAPGPEPAPEAAPKRRWFWQRS
jgi:hypothetical protein